MKRRRTTASLFLDRLRSEPSRSRLISRFIAGSAGSSIPRWRDRSVETQWCVFTISSDCRVRSDGSDRDGGAFGPNRDRRTEWLSPSSSSTKAGRRQTHPSGVPFAWSVRASSSRP
jgi:hypothetical protein